ncbi:MAG: Uma2 family endonuclease [Methylococcaceae bacterium]|nr:MAG: Uma2 family endonuclease [Methylococcaceae bacterium]
MTAVAKNFYTQEQYLALERAASCKSEYINGEIFAMAGASRAHNLISVNIAGALGGQLKGRACEAYVADMRVKVSNTGLYTYPDIVVACGDIQLEDQHHDTLLNPMVIIEVLSPSTEQYDRGEKFAHYRRLPSLQEYVLVTQEHMRVEHYLRDGERWILTEWNGADAVLNLTTIDCRLSLREIYDKVAL